MNGESTRRGRTIRIALVTAAAAAFTGGAAGCSSHRDDTVYCIDRNDRVVDDRYCDDNYPGGGRSGGYYIWHRSGRHSYPIGSKVSGGERFNTDDANARAKAGLPRTGPVSSGTISRGGIGHGSSDSHGG